VSSTDPAASVGKRPYDARNRRERAERERAATRRRVVDAAGRLFVANGYTATTMTDIAREAGVAIASVYKAGKSKADLLHLVVDLAVAGDDEDVKVHERPQFGAIAAERDPRRQVALLAAAIADVQERSAPVQAAYREAAATDATVATSVRDAHHRRHETFALIIGALPADQLRNSVAESTDLAWTLGSPEVFQLLRDVQGWSAERYLDWLTRTLTNELIAP